MGLVMSGQSAVAIPDTSMSKVAYLLFDLGQPAGTYDLATVAGGDILITRAGAYNQIAAVGIVSAAIVTNDKSAVNLLAVTPAATLNGGVNLPLFSTPFILPVGKKIQGVLVGAGQAGQIYLAVEYRPLQPGAILF